VPARAVLTRRTLLHAGCATAIIQGRAAAADVIDIRSFGAAGDGRALDTAAINRALAAAASGGGGTVLVPPGTWLCHSLHLQSRVILLLAPGAVLLGAEAPTADGDEGYDAPEPDAPWAAYQDFGHNHWHNSLIWGDGISDAAILGPGLIHGRGLSRSVRAERGLPPATAPGAGNKAIALRNCRNIVLRDLAIQDGGHFGVLATGCTNLTLDNLTIDTDRDGINIDGCREVRITGCRVNSPWDDGICLKSTFALGEARPTENVTISDCHVTGLYREGTLRDGSFRRFADPADDNGNYPTGRIKLGTESVGGFRNITIANCTFEGCRGFALECVDGGTVEDIVVSGLVMRDIRNTPFFLRLGARLRAPPGRPVGVLRRIVITDIVCDAPANTMPAIIAGLPGHPVEDVLLSNIRLRQMGGGSAAAAAIVPPELDSDYPEPSRFGPLPACGLFVRHARNLQLRDVGIATDRADARPALWFADVDGADAEGLRLPDNGAAPAFALADVRCLRIADSDRVPDGRFAAIAHGALP
jgi:polygalacturonase